MISVTSIVPLDVCESQVSPVTPISVPFPYMVEFVVAVRLLISKFAVPAANALGVAASSKVTT